MDIPDSKKHFLVTGGAGFVGSHLVAALLGNTASQNIVTVIDNLSSGALENIPDGANLITADVTSLPRQELGYRSISGIFHLAAVPSVQESIEEPFKTSVVNAAATQRVIEWATQFQCPVVFTSSAAVYGDQSDGELDETSPIAPISSYGLDKYYSERCLDLAVRQLGIGGYALRLFNVYGPKQVPNSPYSGVVSRFSGAIRFGKPCVINGDGLQTRDFIYVGDVVDILCRAMSAAQAGHFGVLNVCRGESVTINDLAHELFTLLGRDPVVRHIAPRPSDIRHSRGNPQALQDTLGIKCSTPLSSGLQQLLTYKGAKTDCQDAIIHNGKD